MKSVKIRNVKKECLKYNGYNEWDCVTGCKKCDSVKFKSGEIKHIKCKYKPHIKRYKEEMKEAQKDAEDITGGKERCVKEK